MSKNKIRIVSPTSKLVKAIASISQQRKQMAEAQDRSLNSADVCSFDPNQISEIINNAFWASLEVEEGRQIRGVLTIVCPEESYLSLSFKTPQSLTIGAIVALTTASPSKAIAIHSGINNKPEIWGLTALNQLNSICIRITGLGSLIVSFNQGIIGSIYNGQLIIPKNYLDQFDWLHIASRNYPDTLSYPEK